MIINKYFSCRINLGLILSWLYNNSIYGLILFLFSCNQKSHYAFETKEIDFVNKTSGVIEGKPLNIDILGSREILICDTLLLVTTENPNGQLKVLSINSFEELANLCTKGRAKNEFIEPYLISRNYELKEGHISLWLTDNITTMKKVDITESIKKRSTVILQKDICMSGSKGNFVLIDNDVKKRFVYNKSKEDKVKNGIFNAPTFSIEIDGEPSRELIVYPKAMDTEISGFHFYNYNGKMYKHPDKNLVFQGLQSMDYILFFDLDKKKNWAIHQKGSLSFDDVILEDNKDIDYYHFSHLDYNSDYIMFLYVAGDYSKNVENYGVDSKAELLIFDWDGNYLGGAKLGSPVSRIAFDKRRQLLIGLDCNDDKFYSFDLSELMSSIDK